MKIREVPPGRLVAVSPQTTLVEVAREMRLADGVDSKQATASVVMTPNPATVTTEEDVSVVALKMMRLGIRHLPVVDAIGKPVGLLSARNLVAVLDRNSS